MQVKRVPIVLLEYSSIALQFLMVPPPGKDLVAREISEMILVQSYGSAKCSAGNVR